jgi:hypothetical protein
MQQGSTACALELAYRYETGDFAPALLRLALDLERQLPGFTMAHVVDHADEFTA